MVKTWLAGLAAGLVLFVGEATGSAQLRQDLTIPMDDGVSIAATLYLPDGAAPAGGWPAVVALHGLGENREVMNGILTAYGLAERDFAVLSYDSRGHGQSGGLVTIDGPREIADIRAVYAWLAARSDISDTKIASFGESYGGGGALNSLVAGVPWAAVVAVQTWTDLYSALMPQGLVKSGLVAGLIGSIPEAKRDPSLNALVLAALAGNVAAVKPWAAERSSLAKLRGVTTPVFLAQGRRDFLFGIDQAAQAFQVLKGPKVLYLGLHGHAPSTFPAGDTGFLLTQVKSWLDCHLRAVGCAAAPGSVYVAPESFAGQAVRRGSLPPTRPTQVALPGVTTFAKSGKAVRRSTPLRNAIEIYGSPIVKTQVAASGGWSRLVAVLTARTPQGKEIVVSAGGVPTKNGLQTVKIQLASQATFVPRGSRLTLTLGSSSLAQSPANLLYLDLPMPDTARVRIGSVVLTLPGLRTPVTK